jgi:hypothetical protein
MARGRTTLDRWIKDAMNDPDKDGSIAMLSLVHMQGTLEKEIHTIRWGGRPWDVNELAGMFRGKAETYAQDLPGTQTFCLLAFYGKSGESQARFPFKIEAEQDFGGLSTEGPSGSGMVQQAMRHNEAITALFVRQTGVLFESSNRMQQIQQEQNARLMTENGEMFGIIRSMLQEKIELEHTKRMEEAKARQAAEERKQLLAYAPALINTILGREVFPQSTADTALVEQIAEKLTADDVQKLTQILPPTIMAPLADRFGKVLEQKRLNAASDEKLLEAANIDPLKDELGGKDDDEDEDELK